MAIVSKVIDTDLLAIMLDAGFNSASIISERFDVQQLSGSVRGSSSESDFYAPATTGSGLASVALNSNVVINVIAESTGLYAVDKIIYTQIESINAEYEIYTITISPAEEFLYAGTITVTSATISISATMT